MSDRLEVMRATADDIPVLSENSAWAFGGAPGEMAPWFERCGIENIRVIRRGARIVGQMAFIDMGQFVGGRSVKLAGVAAVAVLPDARGLGAGTQIMEAAMREARLAGYPLSGLYPATQPIYRSVGYEQSGTRWKCRIKASEIDVKDHALEVAPLETADEAEAARVYAIKARRHEGHLDRSRYIWERTWRPLRGNPPRAMKVLNGGAMEGYCVLSQVKREGMAADFTVNDVAALTPAAGRRILSMWADHKSLAHEFSWWSGPDDPLLYLLREQEVEMEKFTSWMLRILDVKAALEARGWAPGVSGELHLAVDDPLFPENGGNWTLTVGDGCAQVSRGGRGSFRVSIRGLAPLYSGFLSADALQAIGWVEAPEAERSVARALFAGPIPWMPDMY